MDNKVDNVAQKFILIYTSDSDQSTSEVIDWLIHYKKHFVRINYEKGINIKAISVNENTDIAFFYEDKSYNTSSVEVFWYRKGEVLINTNVKPNRNYNLNWYLQEELNSIKFFFKVVLDKKTNINYIINNDVNKLLQLTTASSLGLIIPDTIITNNINDLSKFLKKQKSIITKSIQVPYSFSDDKNGYTLMTNDFDKCDIDSGNSNFFYTKFQKKIIKKYEIRIFYLHGNFYSMAIFSQNNFKTQTDFRNYDTQKPNRRVPYNLPKNISKKLIELMKKLNLNSGSIDMIVDSNDIYYFLEVNPVGQFGMVSKPCNYYIEKIIADNLSKI